VFGESESRFEGHYSEEEIKTIFKFIYDMDIHDIPSYDVPCIEFEKDGKIFSVEDYVSYVEY
jgi:hypothetical protein